MKDTGIKNTSDATRVVWNWRAFITSSAHLKYAEGHLIGTLHKFQEKNGTMKGIIRYDYTEFHPVIKRVPQDFEACERDNKAGPRRNTRDNEKLYSEWSCDCSIGIKKLPCNHTALLALYREEKLGVLSFTETKEERLARFEKKKAEERERYKTLSKYEKQNIEVSALDELKDIPGKGYVFNMAACMKLVKTNFYELEQLEEMRKVPITPVVKVEFSSRDNRKQLSVSADIMASSTDIVLSKDGTITSKCSCGEYNHSGYYWYGYYSSSYNALDYNGNYCAHKLRLLEWIRDYIVEKNPGDETDYNGDRFLKDVMKKRHKAQSVESTEKAKTLNLRPVFEIPGSVPVLRMKISNGREKEIFVKDFESLVDKYNKSEQCYVNGRSYDFSRIDFNDASMLWMAILKKQESFKYSTYSYNKDGMLLLKGRLLEDLYEMGYGKTIYMTTREETHAVSLSESPCTVDVIIDPINKKMAKQGIVVSGVVPKFLEGSEYKYFLGRNHLSRVDDDAKSSLSVFDTISNHEGSFSFRVGKDNLQEFYYRVLPSLTQREAVIVHDNAWGLLEKALDPEAAFTFYLDLQGSEIKMRAKVAYGDENIYLKKEMPETTYARDLIQEERVYRAIKEIFRSEWEDIYTLPTNEETLYRFLTHDMDTLSSFGEVKGTNAFNALKVREVPMFTMDVSVSVESGLLDLEILTKDLSHEDLLALLESYREKKKYHRLQSGDFIVLEGMNNSLGKIDATLGQLNLTMEEVLNGKGHVPLYRALYVNSLLEEREELVAKRDKTLTQLVRSFKTIKDSDFLVPAQLETVLRPYQETGCKWLNVLSQSGFGGILADEMGLGKTLQLLAVLDSARKENPGISASLVVCPASLVYNWVEEAKRFTPDMAVKAIAGPMKERTDIIQGIQQEGHACLYVTSYDLLKRDIAGYNNITFETIALDEAQYIKNQNTAVTKSVKVLKARHRLALTGTPIENRLSELWSIFDYLMPGFLYDHTTFTRMFEAPIVKSSDEEASKRLKKMTSPFIMRRLKTDVLKDLPEKLEEIRYTVMEDGQRKLYDAQVVKIKGDLSGKIGNKEKIKIFAELTKLREICCDPSLLYSNYHSGSAKREAFIELVQNAMDGGHRMLVFSQFTSMLELLEKDLNKEGIKYYKITGSTAKEERLRLVNQFNNGDIPVFLISLKAGGTGLNLTGADIVIHYDPWWNVAATNQATDRAHRIGQTKQVTVYKMIAKDTIEEKILDMQMMKQELADAFVNGNGESLTSLSTDELLELLS